MRGAVPKTALLCVPALLLALLCLASTDGIELAFHKQVESYSCGAACLQSLLEYWGVEADQRTILDKTPPRNRSTGYTVGELKDIAAGTGLQAFGITGNINFLEGQLTKKRPVMVPIMISYNEYRMQFAARAPLVGPAYETLKNVAILEYSHFVLVMEVDEDSVRVLDPMYGKVRIPRPRFEQMWAKRENAMLLVASR
ncbi:cysteine peptidase family C39 domain-containing protein [Paucidesulfovibrio longus]|uniref:cysteine peptidase family C39 domain-containing protein n=1 Tax=Paucidesulfovibrio longus TaxID=889 RepID=UPI0003B5D3ED|nr:cysteine peptidase family C39 domain-containing protein [Paucidesulfovibrio longus]